MTNEAQPTRRNRQGGHYQQGRHYQQAIITPHVKEHRGDKGTMTSPTIIRRSRWKHVAVISGLLLTATLAHAKGPTIQVDERTVDAGNVRQGDQATITFKIKNTGDQDLTIFQVSASCGCTVPKNLTDEQKRVEPGETLELEATFDSRGRRGVQRKEITVVSNDPIEPRLQLYLTAKIVTLFEINVDGRDSRGLRFGKLRPGQTVEKDVDVLPTEPGKSLEIGSITLHHPSLTYTTEPLSKDNRRGFRVILSASPDAVIGSVTTPLIVEAKSGEESGSSSLTISGEIIGELGFRPPTIKQWQPALPGTKLRPVTVSSHSGTPFEIYGADAGPTLSTTITPNDKRNRYTVTMEVKPDAAPGPFGHLLKIRTNSTEQPLLIIPVFANVRPLVDVYPPMILFDGTSTHRTIRLEANKGDPLPVGKIHCDLPGITAKIDNSRHSKRDQSVKYLQVKADASIPKGRLNGVIKVEVGVRGMQTLEIPVEIRID